MVVVPFNGVNCKVMVLVSFLILTAISFGTEMDVTFFSSYQEQILIGLVEIEAHAASKTVKESLLLIVS